MWPMMPLGTPTRAVILGCERLVSEVHRFDPFRTRQALGITWHNSTGSGYAGHDEIRVHEIRME